MSTNKQNKDWFDWAESYVTGRRSHDEQWHDAFSPQAARLLEFARQAAVTLKHDAVGAEHILAGLLKLDKGPAVDALKQAGITLSVLRDGILADRGVSLQEAHELPWTPRADRILWTSRAIARAADRTQVDPEDIFLAILEEVDGLPARMFRTRKIDMHSLRSAISTKR